MITGVSVPRSRQGGPQGRGGGRPAPPPPSYGGYGAASGGTPSRFGPAPAGSGTPSSFGGGTPSAFGGGTPSAFGGGAPAPGGTASAFGGAAAAAGGTASAFGPKPEPPPPPPPAPPGPVKGLRPATADEPNQAHFGLVVKPIPKPLNTALRGIEPLQIVRAMRPTIGRDVSVWMLRTGYFMGLVQSLDKEYLPWSMLAGRKLGKLFEKVSTPAQMKQLFESMKIGQLELDLTPGKAKAELGDCMICANMMGIDEPCCSFVSGLIGAMLNRITGKECVVRETTCSAMRSMTCRFSIDFQGER